MKTKNLKAMCSVVLASSLIGGSVIIGMSACSEHETETPTVAEKQTESATVIDGGVPRSKFGMPSSIHRAQPVTNLLQAKPPKCCSLLSMMAG